MPSRQAKAPDFSFSSDPLRAAFQQRSWAALNRIASQASTESLAEALAASTDVGALARVLGDAAIVGAAVANLEPLAPLVARNAEHRVQLLASGGGALSTEEVAALLGITRQAVDKRRRAHRLLGFRQGSDWRYPRCQFDEAAHDVVTGLPEFLSAYQAAAPWVVLDVLLAPDDSLGGRNPLQMLRAEGWSEALKRLARSEQGDGFA